MELLITIVVIAIAIIILLKYLRSSRAVILDRTAMLNEDTKTVVCPACQTKVKRQEHGQQCPNCKKDF